MSSDLHAMPAAAAGPAAGAAVTAASSSAARRRKLHAGHFAFMRAVVQGLDLRDSWERYLCVEGVATDQRTVRATIAWIRDEFAAAAQREDRFGTARLVRLDAARIADRSLNLPRPGLEHAQDVVHRTPYNLDS